MTNNITSMTFYDSKSLLKANGFVTYLVCRYLVWDS